MFTAAFLELDMQLSAHASQDPALAQDADTNTPLGLMEHVARYTGLDDVVKEGEIYKGSLPNPGNIAWRRATQVLLRYLCQTPQ